jgi:hypothetical protein
MRVNGRLERSRVGLAPDGAIEQSESYPQPDAEAEKGKDQHENWGHDAAPRQAKQ